jgi:hypothetical protein
MFGVVLWSAEHEQKAVIWCEDHGNLAFYTEKQSSLHDGIALDAGDLFSFELYEDDNLRYAQNPKLVSQGEYDDLAGRVRKQGGHTKTQCAKTPAARANVVALNFENDKKRAVHHIF